MYQRERIQAPSYSPSKQSDTAKVEEEIRRDGWQLHINRVASCLSLDPMLAKNITLVTKKLSKVMGLEGVSGNIDLEACDYLFQQCSERPEMIGTLSTLVALLNAQNNAIGLQFATLASSQLRNAVKNEKWALAETTLIAIASLTSTRVFTYSSYMTLMESMLNVLSETNIPRARSDWFVYAVLQALPYAARGLSEKKGGKLQECLDKIQNYMKNREENLSCVRKVFRDESADRLSQEEYLECLWDQIRDLKIRDWDEQILNRPYTGFENELSNSDEHTFPEMSFPQHHDTAKYPNSRIIFRIFGSADVPEYVKIPSASSIERFICENNIRRILYRKTCAASLTAVTLLEYPEVVNDLPFDFILVEVVLGEMLQVPGAKKSMTFYGSVLQQLNRKREDLFGQTITQAILNIYARCNEMNQCSMEKFVEWFAWHLNDMKYVWTAWNEWATECCAVSVDQSMPKRRFVVEVLEKISRFQFHVYLLTVLSGKILELLPTKPDPVSEFTTKDESTINNTFWTIRGKLLEKIQPEETLALIKRINEDGEICEVAESKMCNKVQAKMLVQTLFSLAYKTCTHMASAICKYRDAFQWAIDNDPSNNYVLQEIASFFQNRKQAVEFIIDRLLRLHAVHPTILVRWVFTKEIEQLLEHHTWNIIGIILNRADATIVEVGKQLSNDEAMLASDERANLEGKLKDASGERVKLLMLMFQLILVAVQNCRAGTNRPLQDYNYLTLRDRFQQMLFRNSAAICADMESFGTLLFSKDVLEADIYAIWDDFKQMEAENA